MRKIVCLLAVLAFVAPASAVNVLTNGDWGTGDETGWTRWTSGRPTEQWAVTAAGPTPPEGTLTGLPGNNASFGWFQVVEIPASEDCTVEADWTGSNIGWAEVMLYTYDHAPTDAEAGGRADVGDPADIAYKQDAFGLGSPTFGWQPASLNPLPGGNGGTIHSQGWVVVALKLGVNQSTATASFDNITLTPEPAAALLLGLPLLFLRRRR